MQRPYEPHEWTEGDVITAARLNTLEQIAGLIDHDNIEIVKNFATEYTPKSYKEGDYCLHNLKLYWCRHDIPTAKEWSDSDWLQITMARVLEIEHDELGDSFATRYSTTETYNVGDYVWYNGWLWRCIIPVPSTDMEWREDNWMLVSISEDVAHIVKNIVDQYNNTKTYQVDDYCIYNSVLYKCITEINTPESNFNYNHWEKINVKQILDELKNKLDRNLSEKASKNEVAALNVEIDTMNRREVAYEAENDERINIIDNEIDGIQENITKVKDRLATKAESNEVAATNVEIDRHIIAIKDLEERTGQLEADVDAQRKTKAE